MAVVLGCFVVRGCGRVWGTGNGHVLSLVWSSTLGTMNWGVIIRMTVIYQPPAAVRECNYIVQ